LERLRIAAALGLPLAEADVHAYRGRLEVRHLKTAGPLPLLWDRWKLASARAPRLQLETLLAAGAGGPELMLDLKGHGRQLPARLLRALAQTEPGRRVTVCSQDWALLESLRSVPDVRIVHSIGNRRALEALLTHFAGDRLEGVSIHRRLLDPAVAAELRTRADLLLSWPVESIAEGRRLAGLGVDGLISQAFEALTTAFAAQPTRLRPAA
jgi:glycerophosphoryl diester phosphodiesterase